MFADVQTWARLRPTTYYIGTTREGLPSGTNCRVNTRYETLPTTPHRTAPHPAKNEWPGINLRWNPNYKKNQSTPLDKRKRQNILITTPTKRRRHYNTPYYTAPRSFAQGNGDAGHVRAGLRQGEIPLVARQESGKGFARRLFHSKVPPKET